MVKTNISNPQKGKFTSKGHNNSGIMVGVVGSKSPGKKKMFLVGIVVFIIVIFMFIGALVAVRLIHNNPKIQSVPDTNKILLDVTSRKRSMLSSPPASSAPIEQKTEYYNQLLSYMRATNDGAAAVKIYYAAIKPQKIPLGYIEKDWLVGVLISNGHGSDAKTEMQELIATLKLKAQSAQPLDKQDIEAQIKTYEIQVKNL